MTPQEQAAMEQLIAACRNFVRTADEFWPEYPGAVGESLDWVETRLDELGRVSEGRVETPGPILPPYEA